MSRGLRDGSVLDLRNRPVELDPARYVFSSTELEIGVEPVENSPITVRPEPTWTMRTELAKKKKKRGRGFKWLDRRNQR